MENNNTKSLAGRKRKRSEAHNEGDPSGANNAQYSEINNNGNNSVNFPLQNLSRKPQRSAFRNTQRKKVFRVKYNPNPARVEYYGVSRTLRHKNSDVHMAFKRYIRPCLERKDAYGQRIVSPAEVEMIKKIYRRAYTLMRAPKRPISQPNLTKKKANDAHIRAIMAHFLRKVGNPNREIAPGRAAIFAIPPEYADLPDKKKIKIFEGILRQLGASFENEEPRKNTLARVKDVFSKFAPHLPYDYNQRIQEFIDSYPLNSDTASTSPSPKIDPPQQYVVLSHTPSSKPKQ